MPRLGIIAGGGKLPERLVKYCQLHQRDFFILALQGQADDSWFKALPHAWVKLGETNKSIRILKQQNVDSVVLAGAVKRPRFFDLKPDWRTISVLLRAGFSKLGDDALLRVVAREFEKDHFKLLGAHEIDPSILTPSGVMTLKQPSPENMHDIDIGIKAVKTLGADDRGQAGVVVEGRMLGLEDARGTDTLLKTIPRNSGGILIKACKPQQDKRLDLPTIGLRTVTLAHAVGLAGIALEADASIILDQDEVIKIANELGLFVYGFTA